jgi:hypothetical protein
MDGFQTKKGEPLGSPLRRLAEWTGLEPATPGVTGRYSNQLNYHSRVAQSAGSRRPATALLILLVGADGFEPPTFAL